MSVTWIKVSTSMFEDEKIRLIEAMPDGDTMIVIWVRLLTQAGKTNDKGYIYLREGVPYTPEMLSVILNKEQSVVEKALQTFLDFGMIEVTEKGILIANWEKHQNIDGLDRIREQNRERKRRQRKREKESSKPNEKEVQESDCDMSRDSHADVTPSHAPDKEEDIDKEIDKDNTPKSEKPKAINLSSTEDIQTFVESLSASNPLAVQSNLLVRYIDCLRMTRRTCRISSRIIENLWQKWLQFDPDVVSFAMWEHVDRHDDKREEYTLGIMRRTDIHEARRRIIAKKNRIQGGDNHAEYGGAGTSGGADLKPQESYFDQYDGLFAN